VSKAVVDISSGGNNALSETVNKIRMNYVRHSLSVGNTELDDYDKQNVSSPSDMSPCRNIKGFKKYHVIKCTEKSMVFRGESYAYWTVHYLDI